MVIVTPKLGHAASSADGADVAIETGYSLAPSGATKWAGQCLGVMSLAEPESQDRSKPLDGPGSDGSGASLRRNYLLLRKLFVLAGDIRANFRVEIDEIYLILCLIFVADADRLTGADSRRAGGASAHTISQMTDIPRETVRRKMQRLIGIGAVIQDTGKLYRLDPESRLVISVLSALGRLTDDVSARAD